MLENRLLLLVRHGLPDYRGNKAGDEPPGPDLSPIGRCQAAQTANFINQYVAGHKSPATPHPRPTCIHTSPLARAVQTARIISDACAIPCRVDSDLKEWHRTESLYDVTQRCARWFHRWLHGDERSAVVVTHGSPLLAIIRTALYLPHRSWANLHTADRFEVAMASLFEILITPRHCCARRLFHPSPRILELRRGHVVSTFPRPAAPPENCRICRPNLGRVVGMPA